MIYQTNNPEMIPPKDAIEKPAILNTTRIAATPVTTTICLTCSPDKLNFTSAPSQ